MKLLILTTASLSEHTGPQARLLFELQELTKLNEISIICLGVSKDDLVTQKKYPEISFSHFPLIYDGWNVVNVNELISFIEKRFKYSSYDLIILQMEIWDLMRELGNHFKGKLRFATIIHAMPFLTSPISPTKNFFNDVLGYANSGVSQYRKEYILKHFLETETVLNNISVISNNKTVDFYIKNYFPNVTTWTQSHSLNSIVKKLVYNRSPLYDFVYVARMEKGKGVEYLLEILKETSILLNRKVSLALAGKIVDQFSENELSKLLRLTQSSDFAEVTFLGWANENEKRRIFSNSAVFIYPSHYDNNPTVLLEALSYGLPCVVWDVCYARIYYESSSLVSLVPLFDTNKFAKTVVNSFLNRASTFDQSTSYIKLLDSAEIAAKKDTQIFNSIIMSKVL